MKTIDMREGMRFGIGVDSVLERACGEAIEHGGIGGQQGGQIVRANVRMIETQESLMETLNISVGASVRYGLASVDAKMDFAKQQAVNEYSLYVLFQVEVQNPPRSMKTPRLKPEAQAIYDRSEAEFAATYGDTYIDEIYSGGEFFGLFTFTTRDESSRTKISAELNASIGTFFAGGDISAAFESTVSSFKRQASMKIQAVMSGGSGLQNPTNFAELRALYANFNASVRDHPIDYKASIKDFRYLPLPAGPTDATRTLRRETIEACGRAVVEGIKQRSRLDYILSYPHQFEPFDVVALRAKRDEIAAMAPRWAARAEACAANAADCRLDGLAPVTVELPARLASADPLGVKWEYVLDHDSRARGYFLEQYCVGGLDAFDDHAGGRYKIFTNNGAPLGGIFWHPEISDEAFVVYGAIFLAYMARGGCEGPLGYPRGDEQTLSHRAGWPATIGDGLDRVSYFKHGVLWWDAQSGVVADKLPRSIIDMDPRRIPRLNPHLVIRPGG